MNALQWSKYSRDYESKLISFTSIALRRRQILEKVVFGEVLNLGCGSLPYLNKDLVLRGNNVVALDFCEPMLREAEKIFSHPNLSYVYGDMRVLGFEDNRFDSVIAVNSISPEKREDVGKILSEAYRVLKKEGVFIAVLSSYDCNKKIKALYPKSEIELDEENHRVVFYGAPQCFYTPQTIDEMMGESGFRDYSCKKIFLRTKQEKKKAEELFGITRVLVYEYFLTAYK